MIPVRITRSTWFFVHDDSLSHTTNIIKQFLAKRGVESPPFSPDLNPPDFFLFPRLKIALKGKRFDDIPDIQRNVTRLFNSIPKEDFLQSFQDMVSVVHSYGRGLLREGYRRAASPLVRSEEESERHLTDPRMFCQNWGGNEPKSKVTCMVLKATANDKRTI
ncbi:histone-lysine N-methyltransferase SETMAR [Trichonephila clavipes]|nr:histone-lysine N-methyltransferase SETMAR [Trichonephila clavipes]